MCSKFCRGRSCRRTEAFRGCQKLLFPPCFSRRRSLSTQCHATFAWSTWKYKTCRRTKQLFKFCSLRLSCCNPTIKQSLSWKGSNQTIHATDRALWRNASMFMLSQLMVFRPTCRHFATESMWGLKSGKNGAGISEQTCESNTFAWKRATSVISKSASREILQRVLKLKYPEVSFVIHPHV